MADTQRNRADILTLFADNVTGQVSAQDLRDFAVTIMESGEFLYPGDFWKQPEGRSHLTDKTFTGWIDYSQEVGSDLVTMDVIYPDQQSGVWKRALGSYLSTNPCMLALACDTYTSGDTTAKVLRNGIVRNTALSAMWSDYIGLPVFLMSDSPGSCSVTAPVNAGYSRIMGYVELSTAFDGTDAGPVWRFDPDKWSIVGV